MDIEFCVAGRRVAIIAEGKLVMIHSDLDRPLDAAEVLRALGHSVVKTVAYECWDMELRLRLKRDEERDWRSGQ